MRGLPSIVFTMSLINSIIQEHKCKTQILKSIVVKMLRFCSIYETLLRMSLQNVN